MGELLAVCIMKSSTDDLAARAKAYKAFVAAVEADPAQTLFMEQIRRDAQVAHEWLAKQTQQTA
jgi:hypothetical protein